MWRIKKREKVPVLEVFKVEESGTGDILSQHFLDWRVQGLSQLQLATQTASKPIDNLGLAEAVSPERPSPVVVGDGVLLATLRQPAIEAMNGSGADAPAPASLVENGRPP